MYVYLLLVEHSLIFFSSLLPLSSTSSACLLSEKWFPLPFFLLYISSSILNNASNLETITQEGGGASSLCLLLKIQAFIIRS